MFKKLLKIVFKLQELKNLTFKPGEGLRYKLQILLTPFKEKPRLLGFVIAQICLWILIITNVVFYHSHSISHTNKAIDIGQMALVNLESDAVIVGHIIQDAAKKEELAKQFAEAQTKHEEKEVAPEKDETALFRAAPLSEDDKAKKKIVLIVTDLGLSKSMTLEAMQLSKNFTLGFSPYANNVDEWIDQAVSKGFEAVINLPMQPIDYPVNDPGPYAMLQNLSIGENLSRLDWILSRSKKIVGVYSNANETFSSSRANVLPVLENLKKHRKILAYGNITNDQSLNSLSSSIGNEYSPVNINIDEELNEAKINSNLLRLEGIATTQGYAVGYINPYPMTIKMVNTWMEGLDKKTTAIVPLSNLFDPITPEQIQADKEAEKKEIEKLADEAKKLQEKQPHTAAPTEHAEKEPVEAAGDHAEAHSEH
jgi:polysaccharide deacetylase 2 family uncharacterized protein YibQ